MTDLDDLPGPFAVLDGGLATELERDGADLSNALWSARVLIDDPEAIGRVHRRYARAGAELVCTGTYQATEAGFLSNGVDPDAANAMWALAARLVRHAAPDAVTVGSLGSYGAVLANGAEYRGRYGVPRSQIRSFHRARIDALSPHVDGLALETVPDADEADVLAELLDARPDPGGWISLACRDAATLHDGRSLAAVACAISQSRGIMAIGINCCHPEIVTSAIRTIRDATGQPVVAYPNSGEHWIDRAWEGSGVDAARFGSWAADWYDAGARIIGGCCRTGPGHVRRLVRARNELRTRLGSESR